MGMLRDMMVKDMRIRGFSPGTQEVYLNCVKNFVKYYGRSPDQLGLEHIKQYQWYLTSERKLSYSYFNQCVAALRFFYMVTLEKDLDIKRIPYKKREKKLPEVLSKKEVCAILKALDNIKHRALLMTIYACGLRPLEVARLRPADIDSQRMVVHIKHGKGRKDRYVMLSGRLLSTLREYWQATSPKPRHWLFPGQDIRKHLTRSSVQKIFARAKQKACITKKVSVRTLRHSFATHLLEAGVGIRVIQRLLGHRSLNSTAVYTHVASNFITQAASPLDTLTEL